MRENQDEFIVLDEDENLPKIEESKKGKRKKAKKKRTDSIVKNVIIAVLSVLLFGLLITTILWRIGTKDLIYTQAQVDEFAAKAESDKRAACEQSFADGREDMLGGIKSMIEDDRMKIMNVLKTLYPDYIVCYLYNDLKFFPIDESIPKNDYKNEYLVEEREEPEDEFEEKGKLIQTSYVIDGEEVGRKGIDVSSYQGNIEWKKVAADGYEFAFIRIMYRGYGTGALKEDTKWKQNVKNAQAAGIKVGVYGVTMAITEEEAKEEAKMMLNLTKDYNLELPYVLDIEIVEDKTSRTYKMDVDKRTDCAVAFLETIEAADKRAMIYHNTQMGAGMLDYTRICKFPVWFANYTIEMYWPYDYDIWQYGLIDHVDGVKGDCDVNIWLKNYEEYLN